MKKKFVAALCTFALALAMPMAAFADISPEKTVDGDTTTFEFEDGTFTDWVYNSETGEWEDVNILENVVVEGAENVTITDDIQWGDYDEEAVEDYNKKIEQVTSSRSRSTAT